MRKAQSLFTGILLTAACSACGQLGRRFQVLEPREYSAQSSMELSAGTESGPMLPPRFAGPAPLYGPETPDSFDRYLLGERVLGIEVCDGTDCSVGVLSDLVMDLESGAIVSALVARTGDLAGTDQAGVPILGSYLRWLTKADVLRAQVAEIPAAPVVPQVEYAELFRERQPSTLQGEITDMAPEKDSSLQVLLKLREENNLHHRVYVGSARYLLTNGIELRVGQKVTLEGLPTRDDKGKIWVCSAVSYDDKSLKLRDAQGVPLWTPAETIPGVSLLSLQLKPAETADGTQVMIRSFVFDTYSGTVPFVTVTIDSIDHLLPLEELELLADGSLRLHRTREEISTLPRVSADGQFQLDGPAGS